MSRALLVLAIVSALASAVRCADEAEKPVAVNIAQLTDKDALTVVQSWDFRYGSEKKSFTNDDPGYIYHFQFVDGYVMVSDGKPIMVSREYIKAIKERIAGKAGSDVLIDNKLPFYGATVVFTLKNGKWSRYCSKKEIVDSLGTLGNGMPERGLNSLAGLLPAEISSKGTFKIDSKVFAAWLQRGHEADRFNPLYAPDPERLEASGYLKNHNAKTKTAEIRLTFKGSGQAPVTTDSIYAFEFEGGLTLTVSTDKGYCKAVDGTIDFKCEEKKDESGGKKERYSTQSTLYGMATIQETYRLGAKAIPGKD